VHRRHEKHEIVSALFPRFGINDVPFSQNGIALQINFAIAEGPRKVEFHLPCARIRNERDKLINLSRKHYVKASYKETLQVRPSMSKKGRVSSNRKTVSRCTSISASWLFLGPSSNHPALPSRRVFASAREKFRILRKFRQVVCSAKRNASLSSSPRQRRAYGHSTSRCASTTERGSVLHPSAPSPGLVVVISCFYAPIKSPICFNKLEHELK